MFESTNAKMPKLDRYPDATSWNFTAPSSSRSTVSSCRSNLISSNSPGSTSIHFRSEYGIGVVEEDDVDLGLYFGLAFATGFPRLPPISSMWTSDISVNYLFMPFTILTHERVPSPKRELIMISTPYLPLWFTTATSTTGPIFVLPRTHHSAWDNWSLRSNVYSRHEPFKIVKLCLEGFAILCSYSRNRLSKKLNWLSTIHMASP